MSTIVLNAKVVRKTIAVQSKVGVPGQTGAAGPAGADGDDGLSAYQVAVAGGFVGTEAQWLASLVGATGPQGIQGVQGPIGIQGPAGEAGATGATGSAGHSPVVIFGSGADADRLTIDGVASGPHLTGPQGATGAPGTTDHSALANLSADTHAQYHTDARGDARYSPLGHSHPGAYDPSGTAAAAVSAHVAAGDPHPGYLTPAEGNAAYEPINANIQAHIASAANPHGVTAAQAGADPAGTASSAIASHLAAGDPHPAYTTAAEAASAAPVQSVAGKTGAVSLAIADTSGLQTALDGKSATGHSHSGLLPAGGTTGQVLTKASATDYDTAWVTGGGGDVAADTHAAASKTTPVDADEIPLVDSAAAWALKKLTWANIKEAILGLFQRGSHNTSVGLEALDSLSGGTYNTAIGQEALDAMSSGSQNTAVGAQAMRDTTTGANNVAVGRAALMGATGSDNVALGESAIWNTDGSNNVAIGSQAGAYSNETFTEVTTQANSVYVGHKTRANAADDNAIVIGHNAYSLGANTTAIGKAATTKARIFGDLGIGTSDPSAALHAVKTSAAQSRLGYDSSNYADMTVSSDGKLTIDTSGNEINTPDAIEITTAGEGIVLKSPNGTRHKITVANNGTLSVSTI